MIAGPRERGKRVCVLVSGARARRPQRPFGAGGRRGEEREREAAHHRRRRLGAAGARAAAKAQKNQANRNSTIATDATNEPQYATRSLLSRRRKFLAKRVLVVVPGAGFRGAAVRSIGPFLG